MDMLDPVVEAAAAPVLVLVALVAQVAAVGRFLTSYLEQRFWAY